MEVKDILVTAAKAVDDAGIKENLHQIAFEKAIEMIAASAGTPVGKVSPPLGSADVAGTTGGDETLLGKVAAKLKLDLDTVKEVYHEADGRFDIIVSPTKLEKAKSAGMKQLALLIAAARQGAELEEFTDAEHIRYFADEFKKYDSANFATDLKGMEEEFRIRREGRKILVKLGRPGWDRAAELVRRLGGAEHS